MQPIQKILVSVNLSHSSPWDKSSLACGASMETAMALAHACAAELLIFTAFNRTDESFLHLDLLHRQEDQGLAEAAEALDQWVGDARSQGIRATSTLVRGKSWQEIVSQVLRGRHDLLVIGPHESHKLFAENVAIKLMRHCPCPVWVAKPRKYVLHPRILVATDLAAASETALHYGVALGRLLGAQVHVLHIVDYPLDRLGWNGQPDLETMHYHWQVLDAAERTLQSQLKTAKQLWPNLPDDDRNAVEVHLAEDVGSSAHAIQQFVETWNIDLLILGTAARHGLPGFFLGNMAERLLAEVPCSLLVVKAPDFHCPLATTAEPTTIEFENSKTT